jgi:hypothetical protein
LSLTGNRIQVVQVVVRRSTDLDNPAPRLVMNRQIFSPFKCGKHKLLGDKLPALIQGEEFVDARQLRGRGSRHNRVNNFKVGCLHPVACTRSGSGFPSNATLV